MTGKVWPNWMSETTGGAEKRARGSKASTVNVLARRMIDTPWFNSAVRRWRSGRSTEAGERYGSGQFRFHWSFHVDSPLLEGWARSKGAKNGLRVRRVWP